MVLGEVRVVDGEWEVRFIFCDGSMCIYGNERKEQWLFGAHLSDHMRVS